MMEVVQQPPSPPVGRDTDLATLRRLANSARRDDDLRLAIVSGEAGMGKSHLVRAFVDGLTDPALVLIGECLDLGEATLPFAPVVQALRGVLRDPESHGLELDGPARAALARLVPELGSEPARAQGPEGIDVGQTQLYEHLLTVLEHLARHHGLLVLVVEDLHFSEGSTRDLLAFLTQNLSDAPVLLVATVRADEVTRRHAANRLLTALRRASRTTEITLAPLGRVPMTLLLQPLCDQLGTQEEIDEVLDRADGNPFFALELVQAGRAVSSQLSDVLLDRFESLSEGAREVIRLAAAAGDSLDHTTLRAVTTLPEPEVTRALREVVDERLLEVTADAKYRFRHSLLQEVVHDMLLPGEAQRLHQALATTRMADGGLRGPNAAVLARHFEIAGDRPRCLEASYYAGVTAHRAVAYAKAQRHFERVATLWPEVADAGERTGVDLAEVLKHAALCAISAQDGRRGLSLAREALSHVDEAEDPRRAALIRMWIGHGLQHFGEPGGVDAYSSAVATLGEADSPERARVLAALGKGLTMQDRVVEAESVVRESIAVARRVGSTRDEAYSLITLGAILMNTRGPAEGLARLEEGRRLSADIGRIDYVLRAHINISDGLAKWARYDEAVQAAQRGGALARKNGLWRSHGIFLQANVVEALVPWGRLEEAEGLAIENVALAPDGLVGAHAFLGQAEVRLVRGDLDGALRSITSARKHMRGSTEPQFAARAATTAASIHAALGDHAAALAEARAGLAVLEPVQSAARFEAGLAAAAVDALWATGGTADDIADVLAVVRAAVDRGEFAAHRLDRWRLDAMTATPAGAGSAWRDAAGAHEDAGAVPGQITCLLALTDHELVAGSRAEAQRAWKRAVRLADDIRADRMRAAAAALGRRAGFVEGDDHADPYGLTARELEVLRLVADGLTNAQIGEQLFITAKTASVHVSHILAKMGLPSRGQAAAEAHRAGLFG